MPVQIWYQRQNSGDVFYSQELYPQDSPLRFRSSIFLNIGLRLVSLLPILLGLFQDRIMEASNNPIEDPSSPYYLHYSHSIGAPLVSQILTNKNYISWSRAMIIALSTKNKIDFVNGSILKPDDNNPILVSSWKINNNIIIS